MDEPTIQLDVNDVTSPKVVDIESLAESSPAESVDTEQAAPESEAKAEETADDQNEEPTEESDAPADADEEDKSDDRIRDDKGKFETAEARKEQLNREIRDLTRQRAQLRQEVEQKNAKVYQAQTPQQIQEEAAGKGEQVDAAMAEIRALQQRQEIAEFNSMVSDLNANLTIEANQVMADFPMFDPQSPEYNKPLAERAAAHYQRVANLQTDPSTGLVYQAHVLPYDVYKSFAETFTEGQSSGQVNGQRATEKMMQSVEEAPNAAPRQPAEDPFLTGLTSKR